MKIKVLGTGSRGNCIVLDNQGDSIVLLDAGIRAKKIVTALGKDFYRLKGAVITHEHKDHALAVSELSRMGVRCVMTHGTKDALDVDRYAFRSLINAFGMREFVKLGSFKCFSFHVEHDCAEPCGFAVMDMDTGKKIAYATDTCTLPLLYGFQTLILECNYCTDLLDEMEEEVEELKPLADRIRASHMSLEYLTEYLSKPEISNGVEHVILTHLSNTRSDEKRMVSEIQKVLPKASVCAAYDGMELVYDAV